MKPWVTQKYLWSQIIANQTNLSSIKTSKFFFSFFGEVEIGKSFILKFDF